MSTPVGVSSSGDEISLCSGNYRKQKQARHGGAACQVRGADEFVVLSKEDYQRLTERKTDRVSFLEESPWSDVELEIERSRDMDGAWS